MRKIFAGLLSLSCMSLFAALISDFDAVDTATPPAAVDVCFQHPGYSGSSVGYVADTPKG